MGSFAGVSNDSSLAFLRPYQYCHGPLEVVSTGALHPLSLLHLSALPALPIATIFFFLVIGQLRSWPGPFHLLVLHSGIASFLNHARLFSLLVYSLYSLFLISLFLSLTFFLEMKCIESVSVCLTREKHNINIHIQYNTIQNNTKNAIEYNTIQHSAIQYITLQYNDSGTWPVSLDGDLWKMIRLSRYY